MGIIELRNNVFRAIATVNTIEDYFRVKKELKELIQDSRYTDEEDKKIINKMLSDKYNSLENENTESYNALLEKKRVLDESVYSRDNDKIDMSQVDMSVMRILSEINPLIRDKNNTMAIGQAKNILKSYSSNGRVNAMAILKLYSTNSEVSKIINTNIKELAIQSSKSEEENKFDKTRAERIDITKSDITKTYTDGFKLRNSEKRTGKTYLKNDTVMSGSAFDN